MVPLEADHTDQVVQPSVPFAAEDSSAAVDPVEPLVVVPSVAVGPPAVTVEPLLEGPAAVQLGNQTVAAELLVVEPGKQAPPVEEALAGTVGIGSMAAAHPLAPHMVAMPVVRPVDTLDLPVAGRGSGVAVVARQHTLALVPVASVLEAADSAAHQAWATQAA